MQTTTGVSNAHANFFNLNCREIFRFTNEGFQHFIQHDWKAMHQKGIKCKNLNWWMQNQPTIHKYDKRYERQIKYLIRNIIQSRQPRGKIHGSYIPMSVYMVGKEGLPFYYEIFINGMHYIVELFETQQGHSPFVLCDIDNGATIYEKILSHYKQGNQALLEAVMAIMNGNRMQYDAQTYYTQTLQLQHVVEQMCKKFYPSDGPWLMHIVIKVMIPTTSRKRDYLLFEGEPMMKRHKTANTQDGNSRLQQATMTGNKRGREDNNNSSRKNFKLF